MHAESKLHETYAAGWGVRLADVQPCPATLAYTNFLLRVAEDPEVRAVQGPGPGDPLPGSRCI